MKFEITYQAEVLLNKVVTKEDIVKYRAAWIKDIENSGGSSMLVQSKLTVKNLSEQLIKRIMHDNICNDIDCLYGSRKEIIEALKQKAKEMGLVHETKRVLVHVDALNFRSSGSFESGKRR